MILRRYIIRQVLVTTALVVGFLMVMVLGGRLIRYFGMAAEGGLQVDFLLRLIGYNLPYFLELILPVSFFIALMLTFGRLYADSEMATINASGISRERLALLIAPLIVVLFLAEGYLSLIAKPWGVRSSETIWQQQALLQVFDLIRPKEFVSSGNYHLYVGEVGEDREYLSDVIIIQTADQPTTEGQAWQELPKEVVIVASRATQAPSDNALMQLDLHDGKRYEFSPSSRGYNEAGFERYRISLEGKEVSKRALKIETNTLSELLARHDKEAHAELGYRFSLPFLMVLAMLFALPLSVVNPRQGRWLKLVPAMFVFVAAALVLISLKNPIEKGRVGVWAYPVAVVLLMALALYMNYHTRMMVVLKRRKALSDKGHA